MKKNPTLSFILIVGAFMRFVNAGAMSFSNDELSSLIRLRYTTFSEMIEKGVYIDFHPAGVQSFMYYWVKIFGENVFWFRFPFVMCGILSLYFIYKIGERWFNRSTGLLTAAVFAFTPFTLLFSQIARMYSPGILFCLMLVWCWTNFIFPQIRNSDDKRKYFIGWIVSMALCLHIHYFTFVFAALVGFTGLFFLKKGEVGKYLLGGIIAVLTFIPELHLFFEQMKTGDIGGWLGAPGPLFFRDYFLELFNDSTVLILITTIPILYFFFRGISQKGFGKFRWFGFIWFILSFAIAFLYSIYGHPVLQSSTLLFSLPYFLLALFSFIPEKIGRAKTEFVVVPIYAAVLIFSTVSSGYYSYHRFGVFKELAINIEKWRSQSDKPIPFIVNVVNPEYYRFYGSKHIHGLEPNLYKIEEQKDIFNLITFLDTCQLEKFGFVWSNSVHPDEIISLISDRYPYLVEKHIYFNSASYLFSKNKPDGTNINTFTANFDFNKKQWDNSKTYSINICADSLFVQDEFSPTFEQPLHNLPLNKFSSVSFFVDFTAKDSIYNTAIIISLERNKNTYFYNGLDVNQFNSIGKHKRMFISCSIPSNAKPDDILKAYLWNRDKKAVRFEKIKFKILDCDDPYKFTW